MMKNFPVVGFIGGLLVTIKTTFRKPVTAEYPVQEKRLPLADKYMGFPALTWDFEVDGEEEQIETSEQCENEVVGECLINGIIANWDHDDEEETPDEPILSESYCTTIGACSVSELSLIHI